MNMKLYVSVPIYRSWNGAIYR